MTTLTVEEFKTKFDRGDFTYSENLPDIRDKDIEDAIDNALALFNQDLYPIPTDEFPTDVGKKCLLFLTAHELVNLIEDTNGQGQTRFNQSSRSVGSISESLAIPEWMNADVFAYFTTTNYGIKFLMFSKPYMDGALYVVGGSTQP
jgi:hypothetical protein